MNLLSVSRITFSFLSDQPDTPPAIGISAELFQSEAKPDLLETRGNGLEKENELFFDVSESNEGQENNVGINQSSLSLITKSLEQYPNLTPIDLKTKEFSKHSSDSIIDNSLVAGQSHIAMDKEHIAMNKEHSFAKTESDSPLSTLPSEQNNLNTDSIPLVISADSSISVNKQISLLDLECLENVKINISYICKHSRFNDTPESSAKMKYVSDLLEKCPEITILKEKLQKKNLTFLLRKLTETELVYLYYESVDEKVLGN